MKKAWVVLSMVALLGLLMGGAVRVMAQEEGLKLRLSRDWGYGGLNGDIQGTFSMKVTGPDTLTRVEFYIDDTKIGEASGAPFNLQFVTDDYPVGLHSLRASGYTADGQQLSSETITANFVSASAGTQSALKIVLPLVGVILAAVVLAAVASMVTGRKAKNLPPGTPRQYPLGGGICPKCGRPFAFHLFGLNMMVGKVDRCPYCGRYGLVHRASLATLRAAEQAEMEAAEAQVMGVTKEEDLKKELDDSKYQSL